MAATQPACRGRATGQVLTSTGGRGASHTQADIHTVVVSTRTGMPHLVRAFGEHLPRQFWEAACGWKFGNTAHTISDSSSWRCKKCKKMAGDTQAGQVGISVKQDAGPGHANDTGHPKKKIKYRTPGRRTRALPVQAPVHGWARHRVA